jgi:hypothetical protein
MNKKGRDHLDDRYIDRRIRKVAVAVAAAAV